MRVRRDDCNEWSPRRLEGFASDGGYERHTCRDVVDEIIVRLPDGSTEESAALGARPGDLTAPSAAARVPVAAGG